jgi:hypothetical protein
MTHKNRKKSRIFMFLSTGCSLLRAEGFSSSLDVLYGGLGISKLQFLIKKIEIKFPAINFFAILGHQSVDPDLGSGSAIRKNAGSGSVSGSALNQCGSEILLSTSWWGGRGRTCRAAEGGYGGEELNYLLLLAVMTVKNPTLDK